MTKDCNKQTIARKISDAEEGVRTPLAVDMSPETLDHFFESLEEPMPDQLQSEHLIEKGMPKVRSGESEKLRKRVRLAQEGSSKNQHKDLSGKKPKEDAEAEESALEVKVIEHYLNRMEEKSYISDAGAAVLKRNVEKFTWAINFDIAPNESHIPHAILLLSELDTLLVASPDNYLSMLRIRTRRQWSQDNKTYGFAMDVCAIIKENCDLPPALLGVLKQAEQDSYVASITTTRSPENPELSFSSIMEKIDAIDAAGVEMDSDSASTSNKVRVISDDACSVLEKLIGSNPARETSMRLVNIQRKLTKENNFKPLAKIDDTTLAGLDEANFPNFSEFSKYLKTRFALAKMGVNNGFQLPPILLLGNPGVGKSEFLSRLSKKIKTGILSINVASAQSASQLTGSDIQWYNAKTGDLFEMLAFGKTANPIVFLDEMDKSNDRSINPTSALYPLLEKTSACEFQDLSLPGVTLDASHVVWIAAANTEDGIDPIILSRFKIFKIPDPTKEQMPAVVQSVWTGLLSKEPSGKFFEKVLSEDVLNSFAAVSCRDVRKLLEDAMGSAAIDGRSTLEKRDIVIPPLKKTTGFI